MDVKHLDGLEEDLRLDEGGAPPPLDPFDPEVDEGPMRGELRRQIAALERQLTRFVQANCPTEEVRTSVTRGPGLLATAQLEEIRDELLATRARLHERLVAGTAGQPDPASGPERPRRRRGLRRAPRES